MNKILLAVALVLAASTLVVGCSSTATLSTIQTSNTYTNKLPLKAAVYVPPDLSNREIVISPSTTVCGAWKAKISSGNGYQTAIESGLSAALQTLDAVKTFPSPEIGKSMGYDLLITVNLSNENSSVTASEGFLTNTINSQFQVSFSLTFADRNGQSLYSYTANGSGFNNVSGGCEDIAQSAKRSMETALKQVADYISQSTYGSVQLSDYAKKPK
jgi:hypothetical protein